MELGLHNFSMAHLATTIGSVLISEWADGEGVSFELDGEDAAIEQGFESGIAIQKANRIGTLTINLIQGARVNDALSSQRSAAVALGVPAIPFVVVDPDGTTRVSGWAVYKKPAPIKLGTTANNAVWTFGCYVSPDNLNVGMNYGVL